MKEGTILAVDDNVDLLEYIDYALRDRYEIHTASSATAALDKLTDCRPDLILLDLMMPRMDGLQFLEVLKNRSGSPIPTIVMSAAEDINLAVRAMKLGAVDYISKPIASDKLKAEISSFFSQSKHRPERLYGSRIVGTSPQIQEVWSLLEKFAPPDVGILLLGESGTGKELFARAIHEMSKRRAGPFVAVDCTTLPETLVESELFGHEKGAFTGATENKPGWFETAHNGTLFLDEIGNLSASVQAKLLRTLQESTVSPVGSRTPKPIDVRLISATNIDLEKAVAEGGFRTDLYYRISAVPVRIPPLREREGDVPVLVEYFLGVYNSRYGKNVTGVEETALNILSEHPWPGNVRELENVVKSALLLAHDKITEQELAPYFSKTARSAKTSAPAGTEPLGDASADLTTAGKIDLKKIREKAAQEAEKKVIETLLDRSNPTQSKLANLLGVDRKTLRMKLRKLGVSFKDRNK